MFTRQHEIEDDQINASILKRFSHLPTVTRPSDPEAVESEKPREQVSDLAIIVNDQDVPGFIHSIQDISDSLINPHPFGYGSLPPTESAILCYKGRTGGKFLKMGSTRIGNTFLGASLLFFLWCVTLF